MDGRRMLLVHAHPDDETITTGATMAHYAAQGVQVTLLTCTLGEEGENLVPGLAGLTTDRADQLGGYRIGELRAAAGALGVADQRFLGGAGRFRDSGMTGTPANAHPRAFWRADTEPDVFAAAVSAAVEVLLAVRPHVLITYDERGDYGHPDHVMAHRVAMAAVERAAPQWPVPKVYWIATPRSVLQADREAVAGDVGAPFAALPPDDELPFGVPDDTVTTVLDARDALAAKVAALRAHATQVAVVPPYYALTNGLGRVVRGVEHYRLVAGALGATAAGAPIGPVAIGPATIGPTTIGPTTAARETDLFAGITA